MVALNLLAPFRCLNAREAMVGHLRHMDEDLAGRVAEGLALEKMPDAPVAAAPVQEMEPSACRAWVYNEDWPRTW